MSSVDLELQPVVVDLCVDILDIVVRDAFRSLFVYAAVQFCICTHVCHVVTRHTYIIHDMSHSHSECHRSTHIQQLISDLLSVI